MNVVSLFDGISCGRVALERANIKVSNYYASEIDADAIKISKHNYPDIIQLGSVLDLKNIDWNNPKIDLLIGGSPCQTVSSIGDQSGFNGKSGLFYEYVRILNEIKKVNPTIQFLMENVKMKKEWQDEISNILGLEPILINSSLVSAQSRKRLYWTNINFDPIKDKNIMLQYVLEYGEAHRLKSKTLRVGGRMSSDRHEWDIADKSGRRYTRLEMERLQTLPEGYTNCVSENKAFKAIGNGWTVDVISEIFKGLK